jgi:hypothetical protein
VFASRSLEVARIQHGHGNGEWHDMVDVTEHSSTDQDPERGWLRGRIFRCSSCQDEIRVQAPDDNGSGTVEPLA